MSCPVTHFFKICLLKAARDRVWKRTLFGCLAVPSPVSMAGFHRTLRFGAKPFPLTLPVLFLKKTRLKDAFQCQFPTFIPPYLSLLSAFDWPTPSSHKFTYWSMEQKEQPHAHFLGHRFCEAALHPSLSDCRYAGCFSKHEVHVLPCVFLSLSTRKRASSWIRPSMLFLPIPKSLRAVSVNRRSCLQVSPLLFTMPDTGRKDRPPWENGFFFPWTGATTVNTQHAKTPLCGVILQLLHAQKYNFSAILEVTYWIRHSTLNKKNLFPG